jgi:hypothetical protein
VMISHFCAIHDCALTIERFGAAFDEHRLLRPKRKK